MSSAWSFRSRQVVATIDLSDAVHDRESKFVFLHDVYTSHAKSSYLETSCSYFQNICYNFLNLMFVFSKHMLQLDVRVSWSHVRIFKTYVCSRVTCSFWKSIRLFLNFMFVFSKHMFAVSWSHVRVFKNFFPITEESATSTSYLSGHGCTHGVSGYTCKVLFFLKKFLNTCVCRWVTWC